MAGTAYLHPFCSVPLFYNNKMSLIIISVLGWGQIAVIHFTQQTGNANLTVQRHLIHSKLNGLIMPVRYFHFSSGFLCTFIVLFNQSLIYSPYNYNLSGSSLVLCLYPYFIISTAECNVYFFFSLVSSICHLVFCHLIHKICYQYIYMLHGRLIK